MSVQPRSVIVVLKTPVQQAHIDRARRIYPRLFTSYRRSLAGCPIALYDYLYLVTERPIVTLDSMPIFPVHILDYEDLKG